MMVATDRNM